MAATSSKRNVNVTFDLTFHLNTTLYKTRNKAWQWHQGNHIRNIIKTMLLILTLSRTDNSKKKIKMEWSVWGSSSEGLANTSAQCALQFIASSPQDSALISRHQEQSGLCHESKATVFSIFHHISPSIQKTQPSQISYRFLAAWPITWRELNLNVGRGSLFAQEEGF